MNRRVRALYKEFLALGPLMPSMPMSRYRDVVKKGFVRNQNVAIDSDEFKKALAWGRVGLREVQTIIHIHKFRQMKSRYDWENTSNSQCSGVDAQSTLLMRQRMSGDLMKVRLPSYMMQ